MLATFCSFLLLLATFINFWLLLNSLCYFLLLLDPLWNVILFFQILLIVFAYIWQFLATFGYFWLLLATFSYFGYFLQFLTTFCYPAIVWLIQDVGGGHKKGASGQLYFLSAPSPDSPRSIICSGSTKPRLATMSSVSLIWAKASGWTRCPSASARLSWIRQDQLDGSK